MADTVTFQLNSEMYPPGTVVHIYCSDGTVLERVVSASRGTALTVRPNTWFWRFVARIRVFIAAIRGVTSKPY